jgi:hypothetical protein
VGAGQQQHVAACEGGPRHGRRSQFGPGSRRASRCPGIAAARARRGGVASRRGSVGGFAGGPLLCFRLSRAPVALRSPVTTRTHPPLGSLLLLPRSGLSPALPPFFSRRPPPLAGVRPSSDGSVQRAMPVHGVRKATALMGACACGPDERCWPLQSTDAMGSHVMHKTAYEHTNGNGQLRSCGHQFAYSKGKLPLLVRYWQVGQETNPKRTMPPVHECQTLQLARLEPSCKVCEQIARSSQTRRR